MYKSTLPTLILKITHKIFDYGMLLKYIKINYKYVTVSKLLLLFTCSYSYKHTDEIQVKYKTPRTISYLQYSLSLFGTVINCSAFVLVVSS